MLGREIVLRVLVMMVVGQQLAYALEPIHTIALTLGGPGIVRPTQVQKEILKPVHVTMVPTGLLLTRNVKSSR